MAVAHDASSTANGTGDLSWTHTPVGTPKGVLVLIVQDAASNDQIIAASPVTYGGTAMTEVALSPLLAATNANAAVYGYFLGSSVPTGAQTVAVDVDAGGTAAKFAVALTVTASGDTAVEDTSVADLAATTTPSVTLTTTVETLIYGAMHNGSAAITGVAPGADYTEIVEHDFGANVAAFQRRTANAAAGSPVCDWVTNSQPAAILAVALKDTGGGGAAPTPKKLASLGVG